MEGLKEMSYRYHICQTLAKPDALEHAAVVMMCPSLDCRTHLVRLPNGLVQEFHFTLALYAADLVEKWDILNLEHKSSIRHIIPKNSFTDLERQFPGRTEGHIKHVRSYLPKHWTQCIQLGRVKVLHCTMLCQACLTMPGFCLLGYIFLLLTMQEHFANDQNLLLQVWNLYQRAEATAAHGWKAEATRMLKHFNLVGGAVGTHFKLSLLLNSSAS